MISDEQVKKRFSMAFPALDVDKQFVRTLLHQSVYTQVPPGVVIAEPGIKCAQLALVMSGLVRVYKLAESGREITLYRIEPGETCVLTTSCILNTTVFTALAVTETPVNAIMLPATLVRNWLDHYGCWRTFVFALVTQRLDDLMTTIDEIAFRRMDSRIVDWLIKNAGLQQVVNTTHQKIADDLGTSREVVSRILKDFELRGAIELRRGEVRLNNHEQLRNLVCD